MSNPVCIPELAGRVLAAPARCGGTKLVCVDGPAGSGKTTLAGALARALPDASGDVPVVHLDDLYDGWTQALGDGFATRIESWLLIPWAAGAEGRFLRYDWEQQHFDDEWQEVPAAPIVILEGCASASRRIRDRASLVVWVEAPMDLRMRRGLDRDGRQLSEQWRAWQAHEQAHFAEDGTRAAADLIVDGTTGQIV